MKRRYFKTHYLYFRWLDKYKYRVDIYKVYETRGKVVVLYNEKEWTK